LQIFDFDDSVGKFLDRRQKLFTVCLLAEELSHLNGVLLIAEGKHMIWR